MRNRREEERRGKQEKDIRSKGGEVRRR